MFTQGNLSMQYIHIYKYIYAYIYMSAQCTRQSKRIRQDADAKYHLHEDEGTNSISNPPPPPLPHRQTPGHRRHFAWRCYLLMKCVRQEKDLLRAATDRKRRRILNFQVAQQ